MLVRKSDFRHVLAELSQTGSYGLDTETTGLGRDDRLFSVAIANAREGFYFNFQPYPGLDSELILPRDWIEELSVVVENRESLFFVHNAKFDLRILAKDGVYVLGVVHCTDACERVLSNNLLGHKPYSLKACALRRGLFKDDHVDAYIKKHKLVSKVQIAAKNRAERRLHFDRVPFDVIAPYAVQDAVIVRQIGLSQVSSLEELDRQTPSHLPKLMALVGNERKLTKVCWRMEQNGIHIDRAYVEKALTHTLEAAQAAKLEFSSLTGLEFQDSAQVLVKALKDAGCELPKTATGRPSTSKTVLEELDHPVAALVRKIRKPLKLASTYYSSFLYYADDDDLIHANIRQGGTETGRFSYSDPNLQNLPKEDDDPNKTFYVRRSFTPINDRYLFVAIDFRQQEFRVMLDLAGEKLMIRDIMNGMDVHEATAQMLGISRKQAKTINFGLLYGMGAPTLAKALDVSELEAYQLKELYFAKLPRVKALIDGVMQTGQTRGYIRNWMGFRNHISEAKYAYILPNHLVQGSCAQVIRVAMVQLDEYLIRHRLRSQMLAQVHDELLFQVHVDEIEHVGEFRQIMEGVYQPRHGLVLHCSIEHSWKSWGKWTMQEGLPDEKARNIVQRENSTPA